MNVQIVYLFLTLSLCSIHTLYGSIIYTDMDLLHENPFTQSKVVTFAADKAIFNRIVNNTKFKHTNDVIWSTKLPKPYAWDFAWWRAIHLLPGAERKDLILVDEKGQVLLKILYNIGEKVWQMDLSEKNALYYNNVPYKIHNSNIDATLGYNDDCDSIVKSVYYAYFLDQAKAKMSFIKSELYCEMQRGVSDGRMFLSMCNQSHNQFIEKYINKLSQILFDLQTVESSWNIPSSKYISKMSIGEVNMRTTLDDLLQLFNDKVLCNDCNNYQLQFYFFSKNLLSIVEDIKDLKLFIESTRNCTVFNSLHSTSAENADSQIREHPGKITEVCVVGFGLEQLLNEALRLLKPMLEKFMSEIKGFKKGDDYRIDLRLNFVSEVFNLIAYRDFLNDLRADPSATVDDLQSIFDAEIIPKKIMDIANSEIVQKAWNSCKITRSSLYSSEKDISTSSCFHIVADLNKMKLQKLCIQNFRNQLSNRKPKKKKFVLKCG